MAGRYVRQRLGWLKSMRLSILYTELRVRRANGKANDFLVSKLSRPMAGYVTARTTWGSVWWGECQQTAIRRP